MVGSLHDAALDEVRLASNSGVGCLGSCAGHFRHWVARRTDTIRLRSVLMSKARVDKSNYGGLILLPWLFGIVAYWLIVATDPYHLRHNGPTYRLADHRYPDAEWPRLIA